MYLNDKKGKTWELNLENTRQLCYAYHRSTWLQAAKPFEQIQAVNLGWQMRTATVNVDWKNLKDCAPCAADNEVWNVWRKMIPQDGAHALEYLINLRNRTRRNLARYDAHVRKCDQINKDNINKMQYNADVTRKIGEVAAGGLVACSSVLTGGLAATALVGGGVLKGVFKYYDKGEVGAAVVEAGLEITVGILGLKSMKGVSEGLICWVIKPGAEFTKSIVNGDSIPQAAASAFVEGVGGRAGDWGGEKGAGLVRKLSEKLKGVPLPLSVSRAVGGARNSAEALGVSSEMAYSVATDWAKDKAKKAVETKRPDASKNMRFIDDCFVNRRNKANNIDEKYVKDLCLRRHVGK